MGAHDEGWTTRALRSEQRVAMGPDKGREEIEGGWGFFGDWKTLPHLPSLARQQASSKGGQPVPEPQQPVQRVASPARTHRAIVKGCVGMEIPRGTNARLVRPLSGRRPAGS